MFEKDLPGKNTTGFGGADIGLLPLETCETINRSWGFNLQDDKHKSYQELIRYLVKAAGNNANFLLNVGPMPNGKVQKEHLEILKEIGAWLAIYGETIYGTRQGLAGLDENVVSTRKGGKLYLHVLEQAGEELLIPDFDWKIKKVTFFKDKNPVDFRLKKRELKLTIPEDKKEAIDTVIEITLK